MTDFLTALGRRVLLFDGAMGTQIQSRDLSIDEDFMGQENCSEVLNLSRPDLVREIHLGYLEAGADAVETNSFGGSPITLGEFDLGEKAFEINKLASSLAREAIDKLAGDGRDRYVIGAIGPGTRLPSLGHVGYQDLEDGFAVQTAGLLAGSADVILCETCQDPLQVKAAVNGAKRAMVDAGTRRPLMVHVTVETTGTMLVGTDIAAATAIIDALDIDILGLNCATGPQEMSEHLRYLSENWRGLISVLPNAGLPELVDGKTHYPLGPDELAGWLERFIAFHHRGWGERDRRLLRYRNRAYPSSGFHAQEAQRWRRSPSPEKTKSRARSRFGLALQRGRLPPGECLSVDRRALQRQWVEEISGKAGGRGLGCLCRHGPGTGEGGLTRPRCLYRLCRPGRDRGYDRCRQPA